MVENMTKKNNLKHLKICFFSSTSDKYGSEISLLELIDTIKAMGADCCVVLPVKGALFYEMQKRNVEIIVCPIKNWARKKTHFFKSILRMLYNICICIPLAIHLKKLKCNLIYSNTILVICGAIVSIILRIPHIWHIHEFGFEDQKLKFDFGETLSCQIMSLTTQHFICISKAIAQKYRPLLKHANLSIAYQSVSLIPQPLNPENIKNRFSEQSFRLIYMAQLTEGKRPFDAINATYLLKQLKYDVNLTILGSGAVSMMTQLNQQICSLGISDCVRFEGYTDYFYSFLTTSDICLVCSKKEGFGRAAIYAMKAGIPVIATNSGGTTEIVCHGVNGLLYPPGDSLGLAKCILTLITNQTRLKNMGRQGKKWADETFTQENYGRALEKILLSISRTKV